MTREVKGQIANVQDIWLSKQDQCIMDVWTGGDQGHL